MKLWIALIILALLVAPKAFAEDNASAAGEDAAEEVTQNASAADQPTEERAAITALLSHHHELPDRRILEEASDDARAIVFDIARDEDSFLFHRQRALKALSHWPDAEVYEYLVGLLEADETEDGLRHHLLPVLANGFGADALDVLQPYLFEASDPQIRISAAGAIAQISDESAGELLQEALESEEHPVVESRLRQYAGNRR